MTAALTLPFALPLLAAAVGLLLRNRLVGQRIVTGLLLASALGLAGVLLVATRDGQAVATAIGTWPRLLSIVWAADGFAALMLLVTAVMASVSVLFAVVRGEDRHPLFHPMVAALLAGVFGSFLTADLFNLFVMFEVMLIASYVLLTLRGGRAQVRAGTIYVAVNLLASTLFLLGIALLYGTAGTVDFAQLAGITEAMPASRVGALLVATAIGVKASLVPMHAWLPRTYVHASPAVTALFSGLLTKVGVYALYRVYSVVFAGDPDLRTAVLTIALLTMVIGVLGAVGRGDMRGILTFHMVSQVGYVVLPLGLWSLAAVTAGIVYLLQYILVKGALFLAAGAVETLTGTGRLKQLGGMARSRPLLAAGFMLPALALAGMPPTSGFVGKYLLLLAALEARSWAAGALIVAVSFFTLLSMIKIWNGVFWGDPTDRVRHEQPLPRGGVAVPAGGATDTPPPAARGRVAALIAPSVVLGLVALLLGLAAPLWVPVVESAAGSLVDPTGYLEAVRTP